MKQVLIMEINKVYNNLGAFLLGSGLEDNWIKAELRIKIQPMMIGYSGKCYTEDQSITFRARLDRDLRNQITWLHELTTKGGHNKWNKAVFTITPDKKFDMEFIWDVEWQTDVDENNRQAELDDPSYMAPKWHWEE